MSTAMLLTLPDIRSIAAVTRRAPMNAVTIISSEFIIMPRVIVNTIAQATVSFAPEDIPRIYGPAIGFAKNV